MKRLLNVELNKKIMILIGCLIVLIMILIKNIFFTYKVGPLSFLDVEIKVFEETKLSDVVANEEIKLLTDLEIDTEEIGTKNIEFKYMYENKKYLGYVNVFIVDDISPTIFASTSYTVVKGSTKDFLNDILCGDNYDNTPTRTIIGEYDLNTVGEYNLTYYAKDSSGNEASRDFKVKVIANASSSSNSSSASKTSFTKIIDEYKNDNTEIGIDVSKWQGNIDFEKVKEAGCEFVIMRLGYQKGLGGELVLDPYYEKNIKKATDVGLKIGVYLYTYAGSEEEAVEQAKWVIDNVGSYQLELGISYDWESWTSFNKLNLSYHNFTKVANSFLDYVSENGYYGMLYSSKYYLENIWDGLNHAVWLAHYTTKTNYDGNYYVWQMTSNGFIEGINGAVDIDILYK